MENLEAVAAIIGVVNGVRLLRGPDRWGFVLFGAAVITGIVFGYLGWFGLTVETGVIAALASSGLYRVAEKVGSK